jgi:hypothetical protein
VGACTSGAGERDDTDAHVRWLILNKRFRSFLRGRNAAGFHVACPHAQRHVDGEYDRPLLGWQCDDGGRASHSNENRRHGQKEQERWDVASEPLTGTERLFHEREARVAHGCHLLAAEQQHVARDQRGYR